jgi:hypothetical protein
MIKREANVEKAALNVALKGASGDPETPKGFD